jgi:hypothetical protein
MKQPVETLALIAVIAIFLGVSVAAVVVVPPRLEHRKHDRALAHIALLERQLGIGQPLDDRISVALRDEQYVRATFSPAVREEDRIYGHCLSCNRTVAVNAGNCEYQYSRRIPCAKEAYRRDALA